MKDALVELMSAQGMLPAHQLRPTAGLLGWLTSIVRLARPWVGVLWGAITEAETRTVVRARNRKNLVFLKQVHMALRTLRRMLEQGALHATFHWQRVWRHTLAWQYASIMG